MAKALIQYNPSRDEIHVINYDTQEIAFSVDPETVQSAMAAGELVPTDGKSLEDWTYSNYGDVLYDYDLE